jgi:hypothetical protein
MAALCLALFMAVPALAADNDLCPYQPWVDLPSDDILAFLSSDYDSSRPPTVAISKDYAVLVWPAHKIGEIYSYKAMAGKVMTDEQGTFVWFNTGKVHTVDWSDSVSRPSVAVNDSGNVVIAFEGPPQAVSYQACRVSGPDDDPGLDCGEVHLETAFGKAPSVALGNDGTVVMLYQDDASQDLWCRTGSLDGGGTSVTWNNAVQYGQGSNPYVAMDRNGAGVVEVHHGGGNQLYIKVGKRNGGTIAWGGSQEYESDGSTYPTVAVSGQVVIELHQSASRRRTYYRLGVYDDDSVTWRGGSGRHRWGSGDEGDSLPCAAASSDGKLLMSFLNPVTSPYTMLFGGIGGLGYGRICPWPTVSTSPVSHITNTSAMGGGKVTSPGYSEVTARGVCWSFSPDPTTSDSHTNDGVGIGSFTSNLSGLLPETGYWVRAYATNSDGTGYGENVYFNTGQGTPTALTFAPWFVTSEAALAAGAVMDQGAAEVSDRGLCWSTSNNPTIEGDHMSAGSGLGGFEEFISGLTPDTAYHLRAYGLNEYGVGYGADISFKTQPPSLATVYTADPLDITAGSATLGGEVTKQGADPVLERGVVWDSSPHPNLKNQRSEMGSGTGQFSQNLTGFAAETTYYLRAYAINDSGHAFGQEKVFTASDDALPRVITTAPHGETAVSALSGGYVTYGGKSPVTARGVCWSTAPNPDLSGAHTEDGQDMGRFYSAITGLSRESGYYVRAYATNHAGTSYGEEYFFHAAHPAAPKVHTLALSDLTDDSVRVGGEVLSRGGGTVSARGVCWSTSPHPKITDNVANAGAGIGVFSAAIGGLKSETVYYVRAFASNEFGTTYGHTLHFRTTFCQYPCR